MAYTEILTTHDLTAEQWDASIASEYLQMLWFRHITGPSTDAVIQTKMDLTKKAGDAITTGIRSGLKGGHVTGNAMGEGNEGHVEFYGFRTTIDNDRQLVRVDDVPMTQKRVPWDVLQQCKEALVEQNKQQLEDDIMTALCVTSTGRVRGRYLYGAVDSNWDATHVTALTNVDNTADQLTTGMIDIAKRKALIPKNATAKIRPMKVKVGMRFEEWYVGIFHPLSIRDMILNDASWKNAQLNLPPQSNSESPIYTGSSFKGSWNGVLIYEWDRVPLVASTIQVSHNLVMGAQAGVINWGQMTKFTEDTSRDFGHIYAAETHEIRGVAKVVYGRNSVDASISDEDNGIIHVFAAAVAD
jgi:N4-gp56 family major capsid protein